MKKLLMLASLAIATAGQVLPDYYIVDLSTEPVARTVARLHRRLSGTDPALWAQRLRIANEQRAVRRGVEREGAAVLDQFETVANALVVQMTAGQAARVRRISGVTRVTAVRLYKPVLDHALPLQKVTDAWQQIGGMDKAGQGIKIAIIDTGIDASHPAFDGSSFQTPDGFPLVNSDADKAYTNGKVIVARAYRDPSTRRNYPARDIAGHGTSVAMIAAGGSVNEPLGPITGVAPRAWLGSYKVFPDSGSSAPSSIIMRAIEDAVNDGMDVLNLSLGSYPAGRPDTDPLVQAVENAVAAGKLVVVAAGNEGPDPFTMSSPGTAGSAISVGSSANDRIFAGSVKAGDREPYVALPGDGPNSPKPVTAQMVDVEQLDPSGLACSALPADSLKGMFVLILRGVCTFESKLNTAMDAGAIAAVIYTDSARPDTISLSAGMATEPAAMVSYSDGMSLKAQLKSDPALPVTIDFSKVASPWNSARLSSFSGKGPNTDYGIKPDMLAVGSSIYTAIPVASGGYSVGSGTSFSSPMVAGAAALLMAARPGLTVVQYRSLLVNSTDAFSEDGVIALPAQQSGAGILNMLSSLSGTVTANPVSLSFGAGEGTVSQARTLSVTNSGTAADTFSISSQPRGDGPAPVIDTNTVQLEPGQTRDIGVRFSGTAPGAGVYQGFLLVRGTQNSVAARVPYWYGVPSQSPKLLQLLSAPATAKADSVRSIVFRFLDGEGLPVTKGVDRSIVVGVTVDDFGSDDDETPGAFWVDVKLPSTPGRVTVHIELGGVSQDVLIDVQ